VGDRANIVIHDGNNPELWIYSHWQGANLPVLLANALNTPQAKSRIGDPAYLTRIIFCQIIKQVDDLDGETGWGISTSMQDNEHPLIHLDTQTGEVWYGEDGERLKREVFIAKVTGQQAL
jgi:hypothetical protein